MNKIPLVLSQRYELPLARRSARFWRDKMKAAVLHCVAYWKGGCKEMKTLMKDFYLLSLLTAPMTSGISRTESGIAQFNRKVC